MTTAFRCSARSPTEKIPNKNDYSLLAIIVVGCFGQFADKRSMMNKAKIAPRIFISLKTCLTSAANQLSDDWSVGATPSVSSTSIKPRRKFFFVVVFLSSLLSLVFQTKGEKMLRIHNIFEASDAAGECVRWEQREKQKRNDWSKVLFCGTGIGRKAVEDVSSWNEVLLRSVAFRDNQPPNQITPDSFPYFSDIFLFLATIGHFQTCNFPLLLTLNFDQPLVCKCELDGPPLFRTYWAICHWQTSIISSVKSQTNYDYIIFTVCLFFSPLTPLNRCCSPLKCRAAGSQLVPNTKKKWW